MEQRASLSGPFRVGWPGGFHIPKVPVCYLKECLFLLLFTSFDLFRVNTGNK